MIYHVIAKENKELRNLHADEINDIDYDLAGRIIVFGSDGQVYYLLADATFLND